MSNSGTRYSLILGVRNRDPERWRQFDAIYRPILLAYLCNRGLREFEADEVIEDVYLKLLNKIGTYDQSKCLFRSWLFKVTQRTLIDFFRRKASRDRVIQEVAARMQQMTPFDSARLEQEWRKIHREKIMRHALKIVRAQVKPDIWACFEQRLLKDRPAAEIARELGVDPNVVFVRASRVLKQVREVCDEFDEDMSYAFESDVS